MKRSRLGLARPDVARSALSRLQSQLAQAQLLKGSDCSTTVTSAKRTAALNNRTPLTARKGKTIRVLRQQKDAPTTTEAGRRRRRVSRRSQCGGVTDATGGRRSAAALRAPHIHNDTSLPAPPTVRVRDHAGPHHIFISMSPSTTHECAARSPIIPALQGRAKESRNDEASIKLTAEHTV